jgi:hypothetical protein
MKKKLLSFLLLCALGAFILKRPGITSDLKPVDLSLFKKFEGVYKRASATNAGYKCPDHVQITYRDGPKPGILYSRGWQWANDVSKGWIAHHGWAADTLTREQFDGKLLTSETKAGSTHQESWDFSGFPLMHFQSSFYSPATDCTYRLIPTGF